MPRSTTWIDLLPAGRDDGLAERIADRGVAGDLRDERPHHRPERGVGQRADRVEDDGAELVPGVAGLLDGEMRGGELEEQVESERLLRRPAPVDRRLADPGPGGHGLEPEPGEAVLHEQLAGRVEDRPVDPVAAGSTSWGGGGLGHPADFTGGAGRPPASRRRRPPRPAAG